MVFHIDSNLKKKVPNHNHEHYPHEEKMLRRVIWHTAIPYRASIGPEQGFPCEVFLTGNREPLSSLQGPCFHYKDYPVRKT